MAWKSFPLLLKKSASDCNKGSPVKWNAGIGKKKEKPPEMFEKEKRGTPLITTE